MSVIVVSGVNLKEGGILSVLQDCLSSLKKINHQKEHSIIVLVHAKELVKEFDGFFEIVEYPLIKQSWRNRVNFEFVESKKISEQLKPDLWISLHDITPNVSCNYQVVYCHNPSPFYKLPLADIFTDYKFTLFNAFYSILYSINIKKNKYVIVQQNWLRHEFWKRYKVKTIVAYPQSDDGNIESKISETNTNGIYNFFFPSFPRVFKNFEIILKASVELLKKRQDFNLIITIDGSENVYSKNLFKHYAGYPNIKFIGLQPREKVFELYQSTDCLLFPSKLETWGLPLSEIKKFNKPVIASDLPYAHEAIGDYNKVRFFNPDDFMQLANFMNKSIDGKLTYDINKVPKPDFPFFNNWDNLLNFLMNDCKKE